MAQTYRQYKFKFYLNMNHYIIINGVPGEVHPHTWEIIISVISDQNEMTPFASIERKMDQIMEQYQDKLLNECKPFDTVVPTVENAANYFFTFIQDSIIPLLNEDSIWDEWYESLSKRNGERQDGENDDYDYE